MLKKSPTTAVYVGLFALCVFFLSQPARAQNPPTQLEVAVVYTDNVVMLYAGTADGVLVGNRYNVVRDGAVVGEVQVVEANENVAFAQVVRANTPLLEGDTLQYKGIAKQEVAAPAATPRKTAPAPPRHAPVWPPEKPGPPPEAPPSQPASSPVQMDQATRERLAEKKLQVKLKGYRYLKSRYYSSTGDKINFLSRTGLSTYGAKLEQGTDLDVEASLKDRYKLGGHFYEIPLQERVLEFDLETGHYKATLGDFSSDFSVGEFNRLNKKITGAQIGYKTKKLDLGFVMSQSKSNSKSVTFNGNNTHGPYDLQAVEILPDSETVLLNGQTVDKNTYKIDYYLGLITFCSESTPPRCRMLTTSDKVQVIFEQKLLLSLTGGNIMGMGGTYNLGKARVGMAFMEQQANRSAQLVKRQNTFTAIGAQLQNPLLIQLPAVPPNSDASSFGLVLMDRGFETVDKNGATLVRGSDYTITDDGYAFGLINLAAPLAATDTVNVRYTAFDGTLARRYENECLTSDDGSLRQFTLLHQTVFTGTEEVYVCRNNTPTCDQNCAPQKLTRGPDGDYIIDETTNSLICLSSSGNCPNQLLNQQLRITYWTVPTGPAESSDYNHTVINTFADAPIGPVNVSAEWARSEADISKTPIQVLKEPAMFATGTVTCAALSNPQPNPCTFTLAHVNIVPDSLTITPSTQDLSLLRGIDYTLDPQTGIVSIYSTSILATGTLVNNAVVTVEGRANNMTFGTGTVIFANYQFNPDIQSGVRPGTARTITLGTKIKDVSVKVTKRLADTAFTPIEGNNTLETSRTDVQLSTVLPSGLTIGVGSTAFDTAQDIFGMFKTKEKTRTLDLAYSTKGFLKNISISTLKDSAVDNRSPNITDSMRKTRDMKIDIAVPRLKALDVGFRSQNQDFTDHTGIFGDTKDKERGVKLKYKPSDKLDFSGEMTKADSSVSSISGSYTIRTLTRLINATFVPTPMITLTADIDSQRRSDSRPDSGITGLNSSTIRFSTRPFGRVTAFQIILSRQDTPSQLTEGSRNKAANVVSTIMLTRDFTLTPSITTTTSSVSTSLTTSRQNSLLLDFRPKSRPLATALTYEWGKRNSSSPGFSNAATTRRIALDLRYAITANSKFTYRADRYSTRSADSGETGMNTDTYTLSNSIGKKLDADLILGSSRNTGTSQVRENYLTLSTKYQVSKILTWKTDLKRMKLQNATLSSQNYRGKLFETELRAEF